MDADRHRPLDEYARVDGELRRVSSRCLTDGEPWPCLGELHRIIGAAAERDRLAAVPAVAGAEQ